MSDIRGIQPSFSGICDFLDQLEALLRQYQSSGTKLTKGKLRTRQQNLTRKWSEKHLIAILNDRDAMLATLSLLFPDLRQDRVYSLKEYSLAVVLAKALGMGDRGLNKLWNWREMEGDLGVTLEKELTKRVYAHTSLATNF